jgi:uncharacterized membrane protein
MSHPPTLSQHDDAPGTGEDAYTRAHPSQTGRALTDPGRLSAPDDRLANSLGWLSHGLGLAGFTRPRELANFIGVADDESNQMLLRIFGVREIASGTGILSQQRPTPWVWSRVAGDLMDLSYLGWSLFSSNARNRSRVAAALASVVGVTAADVWCATQLSGKPLSNGHEPQSTQNVVTKAITIKRPPEELYRFWRELANLPQVMSYLESVQVVDERRSRWKTKGLGDETVEWDAEITADEPNRLIAWQSIPGSQIPNTGRVEFRPAPGDRGTEVHVELQFDAPGGKLGRTIAKLMGKDPGQQIATDLRRLKQTMETGEPIPSDATDTGAGASVVQRPPQPSQQRGPQAA